MQEVSSGSAQVTLETLEDVSSKISNTQLHTMCIQMLHSRQTQKHNLRSYLKVYNGY